MFARNAFSKLIVLSLAVFLLGCLGTTPANPSPASRQPAAQKTPIQPPSDTPTLPIFPTDTASGSMTQSSADQQALKAEWGYAYTSAILLLESCQLTYETNSSFQQGTIDLEEARFELAAESNLIMLVDIQVDNAVPSQDAAPFLWQLETGKLSLIELQGRMQSGEFGSQDILGALEEVCLTFQGTLDAIVNAAMAEGITEASLREIEVAAELEDILETTRSIVLDD